MRMSLLLVTVLTVVGWVAGCGNPNPEWQKRTDRRLANIGQTFDVWLESETRRPGNFEHTLEVIDEKNRYDLARTGQNPAMVGNAIEDDFLRFEERQPWYRQRIVDETRGKPENFEPVAIEILD